MTFMLLGITFTILQIFGESHPSSWAAAFVSGKRLSLHGVQVGEARPLLAKYFCIHKHKHKDRELLKKIDQSFISVTCVWMELHFMFIFGEWLITTKIQSIRVGRGWMVVVVIVGTAVLPTGGIWENLGEVTITGCVICGFCDNIILLGHWLKVASLVVETSWHVSVILPIQGYEPKDVHYQNLPIIHDDPLVFRGLELSLLHLFSLRCLDQFRVFCFRWLLQRKNLHFVITDYFKKEWQYHHTLNSFNHSFSPSCVVECWIAL